MPTKQKTTKIYKNPPIIEAVIELRYGEQLSDEQLTDLVLKEKAHYSIIKNESIEVKISAQTEERPTSELIRKLVGYRLTDNANNFNVVQFHKSIFSLSRLAPYEGWPIFCNEFNKIRKKFYTNKLRSLIRVAVRFINRIDIPTKVGRVELEEYFKFHPEIPKSVPDMGQFAMQTVSLIDKTKLLTISLSSAREKPLLDRASFVLDLDLAVIDNLPTNDTQLEKLLADIREEKDGYFESFLTAKCKKLFK